MFQGLKVAGLVSMVLLAATLPTLLAQPSVTYLPYTPPSLGPITTATAYSDSNWPANRTVLAFGEDVNCSIDPATWSDTDLEITPYGEFTVGDYMGSVTWVASGCGTIMPTTGNSTTLTAGVPSGPADETVTVQALAQDSGTEGKDPLVQAGGPGGAKVFTVKGVTKVICTNGVDNIPGTWTAAPPSNSYGNGTEFTFQLLPNMPPAKGAIRANVVADPTFPWNTGQIGKTTGYTPGANVPIYSTGGMVYNNFNYHWVWGQFSVINFAGKDLPPAGVYKNPINWQVSIDNGTTWPAITPASEWQCFASNATQQATTGFIPSSAGAGTTPVWSNAQGPWK